MEETERRQGWQEGEHGGHQDLGTQSVEQGLQEARLGGRPLGPRWLPRHAGLCFPCPQGSSVSMRVVVSGLLEEGSHRWLRNRTGAWATRERLVLEPSRREGPGGCPVGVPAAHLAGASPRESSQLVQSLCLSPPAQGIMLVYDITNEKSFDNIRNWIRNIEEVSLWDPLPCIRISERPGLPMRSLSTEAPGGNSLETEGRESTQWTLESTQAWLRHGAAPRACSPSRVVWFG